MAKYNVFESTNMGSTHYAERILDAVCTTADVENGTFGYLTGTDDIKTFVAGVPTDGSQIVVVDQPAWTEAMVNGQYISDKRRDKFVCEAGVPFRVRVVKKGDKFATAIEGVTTASQEKMVKDAYVTIDATGKLVASDASTSGAVFEGVVEKVRIVGGTIATAAHNYGHQYNLYEVTVKTLA